MVEVFYKTPDVRNRWWTIPIPTKSYRDGYASINWSKRIPKKGKDKKTTAKRGVMG